MITKILFLVPYPPGQAPSQRFRFEQYFFSLPKSDYLYRARPFLSKKAWTVLYSRNRPLIITYLLFSYLKRFAHSIEAANYDIIFIHRELTPLGFPIFEWFIAKVLKKKIVYDFDDAIWLEDPNETGSLLARIKWKSKIASICKWSYKVSAGNPYLREYARQFNGNVTINPTTIDTEGLHNPGAFLPSVDNFENDKEACIGWTGSHSTLPYLHALVPVFKELEKQWAFKLRVISNQKPGFELGCLEFVPWQKETEIEDLMAIDIGIMPLTDDAWSKGKCGFKALQYMALEKPALVSPVGVNTSIVEHGITGYHCNDTKDWVKHLSYLISNPLKRKEMGKKGREFIKKNYSVVSNSPNFLSLFELP